MDDRIRIRTVEVLSDEWAVLKKTVFDYQRNDGVWETQVRQTYDRGDGAVILPCDRERGTVPMRPVIPNRCSRPVPGYSTRTTPKPASAARPRRSSAIACVTFAASMRPI